MGKRPKGKSYAQVVERMKQIRIDCRHDKEEAHEKADNLLCEWLRGRGQGELVDVYDLIGKWYA